MYLRELKQQVMRGRLCPLEFLLTAMAEGSLEDVYINRGMLINSILNSCSSSFF